MLQESSRSAFDRGMMIHVMGDLEKQMVDRCLQTPSTCTGKCGIVAVPSLPLPGPTTRRLERQGVFAEYLQGLLQRVPEAVETIGQRHGLMQRTCLGIHGHSAGFSN